MTEQNEKTTIAISMETKEQLADLKKERGQGSYDELIQVLIDQRTVSQSTSAKMQLELTPAKYDWLIAGQRNLDYMHCLRDAVR